jgi:hypothetical protein
VISSLRGRCPKPLDECATEKHKHNTESLESSQVLRRELFRP